MRRAGVNSVRAIVYAVILAGAGAARADEPAEPDRTIILGAGLAGEIDDGVVHAGVNAMLEWEAIDGWLELEADVSLLAIRGGHEVPVDLLFKKPFRLGGRFECMVGVGPEVARIAGTTSATRYGAEAAVDLMYWQTARYGAWIEPSYDVTFGAGGSQSAGLTAGAMIGW